MGLSVPSPLARRAVLLLDLDGVLRRFDPLAASAIEAQYHLPFGRLAAAAFDPQFAHPAVRGAISRDEWIRRAGEHLGSVPAMQAFLGLRGAVVPEVLALVREVRATGLHVGLLTNATDTLPSELEHLGLLGELDLVFSSAMFGCIKPEPELFRRVTGSARAVRSARHYPLGHPRSHESTEGPPLHPWPPGPTFLCVPQASFAPGLVSTLESRFPDGRRRHSGLKLPPSRSR